MRETGYYWTKLDKYWEPAFWEDDRWYVIGGFNTYQDDHFDEIDEKQIKRE